MSALIGRRAFLRWVHLVLGGALLMPYWLLAQVLITTLWHGTGRTYAFTSSLASFAVALPPAALTALVPLVRVLEGTAARALCAGAAGDLAVTPARSWAARRRTAGWFVLHLFLGGVVSGMTLSVPPAVVLMLARPDSTAAKLWFGDRVPLRLTALGLVVLLLATNAAAGACLARCAPYLLGPTPAERLAEAERRALVLAQRNRLARELHDSVGHALSTVTIQAAAAGRALERDPAFVAEALQAIEETARQAVGELDTVLGLLREEEPATGAGPALTELGLLVRQLELAGVRVSVRTGPGLEQLDAAVSREAYRIVQEGLSNVLRHAGAVPAELRIELLEGRLEVELTNPIGAGRPSRPGGGRGLRGLAERAVTLRGELESGPVDGGLGWRLRAALPAVAPEGAA